MLCITGFFGIEQFGEHYQEYVPIGHPKSRILCEFAGDNDAWMAPVGGFKEILSKFKEDIKPKAHFETAGQDWVADLTKHKRHELFLRNGGDASGQAGSSTHVRCV